MLQVKAHFYKITANHMKISSMNHGEGGSKRIPKPKSKLFLRDSP